MANPLGMLPLKKQKYIKNIAKGMSKKDAAMSVGYSESTARNAAAVIETDDVKAVFAEIMRREISPKRIAKRVKEGLDAVNTEFFAKDGKVVESRDVIAWSERRQYADMAARFSGYYSPKQEIDVTQRIDPQTMDRLSQVMDKLNILNSSQESIVSVNASHVPWCNECNRAHIEGQHVIDASPNNDRP